MRHRNIIPAVALFVLMVHAAAAQQAHPGDDAREKALLKQMGQTIARIELNDVTLKDAIAAISKAAGLNVQVLWNSSRFLAPETAVSVSLQNVVVHDALELVLTEASRIPIDFALDTAANRIVVRAQDADASHPEYTKVYDVADLLSGPLSGLANPPVETLGPLGGLSAGLSGPYSNNNLPPQTEPAASLYGLELVLRQAADTDSSGTVVRHASSTSFVMSQPADRHRQVQEVLAGLRGGMARSRLKFGAAVLRVSDGRRRAELAAKLQEARDLEGAINAGRARGDWVIEHFSLAQAHLGQEFAASVGAVPPEAKGDVEGPRAPPATGFEMTVRADCWRGESLQFTAACAATVITKSGAIRLSNSYRQLLPRQNVRVIDMTPSDAPPEGGFLLALWHDGRPPAPPPAARAPAAAPPGPTPQSRLARKIGSADLAKISFKDAIQWLQDFSGLTVFAHYNQIEINEDTVVNLQLRDVTVAQALDSILEDAAGSRRPPVFVLVGSIVHIRPPAWKPPPPPPRFAFLDVHDLLVPARPTFADDGICTLSGFSDDAAVGTVWEGTLILKLPQEDMERSQEVIAAARAAHAAAAVELGVAVVRLDDARGRADLTATLAKSGDIAASLWAGAAAGAWKLDRCGIERTVINDLIGSFCTGPTGYRALVRPASRRGGVVEVDIALSASWRDKTGRHDARYTPRIALRAGQYRLVDVTPLDAPAGVALVLWRPKTGDSK